MDNLPLVSIITPSYNQGRFLEDTIRSVLEQDYPHIEYIVMDGGSSDQSVEILREYSDRLSYWDSEHDKGQAQAINKGLMRAHGDFLGWLNSDDMLVPGVVRRAVEAFEGNPEVDVVYGRLERIDEAGRRIPTPSLPKDRVEFSQELILGECVVNQPGSFWRRNVMEESGLLNEDLQYALDYEFWIRLALNGARFKRLSEVAALFRLSQGSKTVGHSAAMAYEYVKVLNHFAEEVDLQSITGLSELQLQRQADQTRAHIYLQAFYGEIKLRRWSRALGCFVSAIRCDPGVIFERRWFDLGMARIKRQVSHRSDLQ